MTLSHTHKRFVYRQAFRLLDDSLVFHDRPIRATVIGTRGPRLIVRFTSPGFGTREGYCF